MLLQSLRPNRARDEISCMADDKVSAPINTSPETDEEVSVFWLAAVLLRNRRLIGACVLAGVAIAVVIALVRPRTYTTTFSFLPQTTQDPSRAGLSSLAGQFGINLGSLGSSQESSQ